MKEICVLERECEKEKVSDVRYLEREIGKKAIVSDMRVLERDIVAIVS